MAVGTSGNGDDPRRCGSAVQTVLLNAELLYPPLLLVSFIASAAVHSVATSRSEEVLDGPTVVGPGGRPLPITKRKNAKDYPHGPESSSSKLAKHVQRYLASLLVLTFLANAATITFHALKSRGEAGSGESAWWCGEERVVYVAGSAFLYLYVLITLVDWKDSPNVVHLIVWSLGLLGELTIFVSTVLCAYTPDVRGSISGLGSSRDVLADADAGSTNWDRIDMIMAIFRLLLLIGLMSTCVPVAATRYLRARIFGDEESRQAGTDETTPLLARPPMPRMEYRTPNASRRSRANTVASHANGQDLKEEEAGFYRPQKLPTKTWYEYCRGYKLFFPYLWPSKSLRLKGFIFCCIILVLGQRVVNVLVPYQLGVVADIMRDEEGTRNMPWRQLLLLLLYKLLQSKEGVLSCLRELLWIPVSQHTYRSLTTAAFEHVHSLSLDFHLSKRTGEVLGALNKGASINTFLEQITFQVCPMLLDLMLAIIYFYGTFGPTYALIVSVVSFYYLYLTVRMAATAAHQRREMVNADREEEAVKNDSITAYETVKYFNAEPFEFRRYRGAIQKFQKAEAEVALGIIMMELAQSVVFLLAILAATMVCAFEVSQGTRTVGDLISLIAYLAQIQGPLSFLGKFYRTVQSAMISGERLLELFKIRPTVTDKAGAKPLDHCDGCIRWDNVQFAYDRRRPALKNVSFECKPGTTTAFVGESGGGKSTIFRLMFRYYNCNSGSIQIDGRDVKDVTIDSVRRYIGVVPQETILFNESVMFNLRYANPAATDEDVFEACKLASIHERILSFADGYNTNVGDRGVRLSGGEKQRVAIARTILKKPKIIMLDEATSALDGETEQNIQTQLLSNQLCSDRTLLIIAHRLSTITHADQIVVLHEGAVVEKGSHTELLMKGGRYATMWEHHCKAEDATKAARVAAEEAKTLWKQARSRGTPGHAANGHHGDGSPESPLWGHHNNSSGLITPHTYHGENIFWAPSCKDRVDSGLARHSPDTDGDSRLLSRNNSFYHRRNSRQHLDDEHHSVSSCRGERSSSSGHESESGEHDDDEEHGSTSSSPRDQRHSLTVSDNEHDSDTDPSCRPVTPYVTIPSRPMKVTA